MSGMTGSIIMNLVIQLALLAAYGKCRAVIFSTYSIMERGAAKNHP
jgi:hypothetical protein